MPVKCSVRLRRSISASRRRASAASARLPADSRTRAASVQAGIERGSISSAVRRPGRPRAAWRRPRGSGPARTRRGRGILGRFQLFLERVDPLREAAGGLVVLDAGFQDGVFFFFFLGELAAAASWVSASSYFSSRWR